MQKLKWLQLQSYLSQSWDADENNAVIFIYSFTGTPCSVQNSWLTLLVLISLNLYLTSWDIMCLSRECGWNINIQVTLKHWFTTITSNTSQKIWARWNMTIRTNTFPMKHFFQCDAWITDMKAMFPDEVYLHIFLQEEENIIYYIIINRWIKLVTIQVRWCTFPFFNSALYCANSVN